MSQPEVTAFTQRLYDGSLRPYAYADEEHGWALLYFVEGFGRLAQRLDDYGRDTEEGLGWSNLLDLNRVPVNTLPYLGQFVGVQIKQWQDESEDDFGIRARGLIETKVGFHRGTLPAMRGAIQAWLSGNKTVLFRERDTSAWHLTVAVFGSEVIDATLAEAGARSQKPAGLILDFLIIDGQTWRTLRFSKPTWQDVLDDYTDWEAVLEG